MNALNTNDSFQTASRDSENIILDVASLLTEFGLCLSVAESCTGGLLSKMLTDISGSSSFFIAGVIAYSNVAKSALIGVPSNIIDTHGAVSAEVAEAMAEGVRRKTGSDIALSVTGIAGPRGGTVDKPVGTVYLGLADSNGCSSKLLMLTGTRSEIRNLSAFHALKRLKQHLSSIRGLETGGEP